LVYSTGAPFFTAPVHVYLKNPSALQMKAMKINL
jgi:hypothetical protein